MSPIFFLNSWGHVILYKSMCYLIIFSQLLIASRLPPGVTKDYGTIPSRWKQFQSSPNRPDQVCSPRCSVPIFLAKTHQGNTQSIVQTVLTIYETYLRQLVMSKVTHFCRAVHGVRTLLLLTLSFQILQQKHSRWPQYFHNHLEICENSLYVFICIFHTCSFRAECSVSDNIMAAGQNWDRTGNFYVKRNAISRNLRTGIGSRGQKLPKI